jgi:hypothetical protein
MAEKLLEIKDLSISFGEGKNKISQLKMPTLISIKVKLSPL